MTMIRRRTLGRTLGAVVFLLGVGAAAPSALAHNSLASSSPADGSTLAAAPTTWTLTFTKAVPLSSASGEAIGSDGVKTDLGSPSHGATTSVIVFQVPPVQGPTVTLRWRLLGSDGHVISGRIQVTVPVAAATTTTSPAVATTTTVADSGTATPTTAVPTPTTVPATGGYTEPDRFARDAFSYLLRLSEFAAALALIGVLFVERFVIRGSLALRQMGVTVRIALITMLATAFFQLLVFAADVADVALTDSVGAVPDVLGFPRGHSMLGRIATAGVLVGLLWTDRARRALVKSPLAAVATVSAAYLLFVAYGGHSRSAGLAVVGVPVDAVHVVAASSWIGGLAVIAVLTSGRLDDFRSIHALARFSRLAPRLVGAVVVTGVIQTVRIHGSLGTLFSTDHGRILLAKITVVMAVLGIAQFNRRSLTDVGTLTADDLPGLRVRLRSSVLTETALGAIAVAVTAALVTSSYS